MVGGFLRKMWKIFFSPFKLRTLRKNNLQKEWRKKAFLLFMIKRKTIFESRKISYSALTALIKIHRKLSHVMQIAVWYFICACELFSIWLFHFLSNFLYVRMKTCKKTSCPFSSRRRWRGENLVEPASSASNKIFRSWFERLWVTLFN